MNELVKEVWLLQLNMASQIMHAALSRAGESAPESARNELHKAIEAVQEASRVVRFIPVKR